MYMKKGWLIKMGSSEKVILVKHLSDNGCVWGSASGTINDFAIDTIDDHRPLNSMGSQWHHW